MTDKFLIVGLGNPGRQYADNRHNIGFQTIDMLAQRHNFPAFTEGRKSLSSSGQIAGQSVILAKPQTFMNNSGSAVRALYDFYKIPLERIIIVYDDIDVVAGTLRLRTGGGHGGQNGVRDIIKHLGSHDFDRLRMGVGRPPGKMNPADYVLQGFLDDEHHMAEKMRETACDALETWLKRDMNTAMTAYNGDVMKPKAPPKPTPEEELEIAIQAHEVAPDNPKPLEKMARLYKRLRQREKAAETHLKLADIHAGNEDARRMIAEMERAVKLQPSLVDVQQQVAEAHELTDNPRRAVRYWIGLAEYQNKQNNADAAMVALDNALRLNPEHPKVIDLKKQLSGDGIPE
ncbi:MAG: aminoacyl-tRNA hydrolase [Aggregatilineales bacterium]